MVCQVIKITTNDILVIFYHRHISKVVLYLTCFGSLPTSECHVMLAQLSFLEVGPTCQTLQDVAPRGRKHESSIEHLLVSVFSLTQCWCLLPSVWMTLTFS